MPRVSIEVAAVSIHAFRGEGDAVPSCWLALVLRFQSTPSGGKATPDLQATMATITFQSTPSGGKATGPENPPGSPKDVSIHAFRGEGDGKCGIGVSSFGRFQSTPSGGKATYNKRAASSIPMFQSTPSGGKATVYVFPGIDEAAFQSTPSGGKATYPALSQHLI